MSDEFGAGMLIGFMLGMLFLIVLNTAFVIPTEDSTMTAKAAQAIKDCPNAYYYYGSDDHRTFCDKLNLGPTNSTGVPK